MPLQTFQICNILQIKTIKMTHCMSQIYIKMTHTLYNFCQILYSILLNF